MNCEYVSLVICGEGEGGKPELENKDLFFCSLVEPGL